jgi:hypothetical protein
VLDLPVSFEKQERQATLYAINGLGLTPQGMQTVLPQLQEIQDQEEKNYHRKLAQSLTSHLPANWIIRNVSIVDVESGTLKQDQLVAVTDGRIVRVVEDKGLDLRDECSGHG